MWRWSMDISKRRWERTHDWKCWGWQPLLCCQLSWKGKPGGLKGNRRQELKGKCWEKVRDWETGFDWRRHTGQIFWMGTPPYEGREGQSPSPLLHCRLCVDEPDVGICGHDGRRASGKSDAGVMCEPCCDVANAETSRAYQRNGERGSLGKSSCVTGALTSHFLMSVYLL